MSHPIWHRLEEESVEAFQAFTSFLTLPIKTQTVKFFSKNYSDEDPKVFKKMAKDFNWIKRADAFQTDRLTHNLLKETFHNSEVLEYRIMLDKNIRARIDLAWKLEDIVARRLAKLVWKDENGEVEADRIPIKTIAQLIQSMGNLMADTEDKVAEYLGVEELVQFMDKRVEAEESDES